MGHSRDIRPAAAVQSAGARALFQHTRVISRTGSAPTFGARGQLACVALAGICKHSYSQLAAVSHAVAAANLKPCNAAPAASFEGYPASGRPPRTRKCTCPAAKVTTANGDLDLQGR
ncbi:hypothetical protein PF003_g9662 [Phytophthora fragariae]|nr:hypothetical protein PF003_g9662 [Phytophthora fragariae]